jgi:hypothetical protein
VSLRCVQRKDEAKVGTCFDSLAIIAISLAKIRMYFLSCDQGCLHS